MVYWMGTYDFWPRERFFVLSLAEHEICPVSKFKLLKIANKAENGNFFASKYEKKKPAIVAIFIFVSKQNSMLSWVEPEKYFMTSGLARWWALCVTIQEKKWKAISHYENTPFLK